MPGPFSHVQLFATLWTVAHQAPLCMGFSRQEYWSGMQCPPPGDQTDVSYISCVGRQVLYYQHHLGRLTGTYTNFSFGHMHQTDREDNHVGSQMLPCRQRSASLVLRQELPQQVNQGGGSECLLAGPPWAGYLAYFDLSFSICKTRTTTVFSTKLSHCEDYMISKWKSISVAKLGI